MNNIHLNIPGAPISQPRQRHRVIKGKDGRMFAGNYTPKKDPVNAYKAAIQYAAYEGGYHFSGPSESPVSISLEFFFPRPKNKVWKTKEMPRERKTSKPDLDNLIKAVKDALTGIIWRDDAQVCVLSAEKWIAAGHEVPHTRIKIGRAE